MADKAELVIKIEEGASGDIRHNPDLDAAFGFGPKVAQPPPLPQRAPSFPNSVLGPDGRSYSIDAYHAAQKRFQGMQAAAEQRSAMDTFFGPPKLPAQPPPLPGQGTGFGSQIMASLGGNALAAAGPIGAAIMGAQQLGQQFKQLQANVQGVSAAMEGLAQNQLPNMGAVADGVMDKIAASLPIVGDLVVGPARVANELAQLPGKLTDAFVQRAGQLAPFSGQITGAEAMRDVRNLQADIREARELGGDMGRLVDAQSRIETTIRDLLLPIKKFVVDVLADRLELIARIVGAVSKTQELTAQGLTVLIGMAESNIVVRNLIGEELKTAKEILNTMKGRGDPENNSLVDQFFGRGRAFAPAGVPAPAPAGGGPVGI